MVESGLSSRQSRDDEVKSHRVHHERLRDLRFRFSAMLVWDACARSTPCPVRALFCSSCFVAQPSQSSFLKSESKLHWDLYLMVVTLLSLLMVPHGCSFHHQWAVAQVICHVTHSNARLFLTLFSPAGSFFSRCLTSAACESLRKQRIFSRVFLTAVVVGLTWASQSTRASFLAADLLT
jgi:hypothetical protein